VDDQRRHVAVGYPPGKVGVHDSLNQEDLSSAGGVDGTAVGDYAQLDAADVDPVGDQPQRDHQPRCFLGSWPAGGAQDADGGPLGDAQGEQYQEGRAEDSDAHSDRRGKGGNENERAELLYVAGRDRSSLVEGMHKQVALVRAALVDQPEVAVRGVLCFVDADWPLIGGAFTVNDVAVVWPKKLKALLTESGPMDQNQVADLQWQLHEAFPRQKQAPPAQ